MFCAFECYLNKLDLSERREIRFICVSSWSRLHLCIRFLFHYAGSFMLNLSDWKDKDRNLLLGSTLEKLLKHIDP